MPRPNAKLSPKIDQVIRSNRASFGLEVKPDGRLIIRSPKHASIAQINQVVESKSCWIERTQNRLAAQYPAIQPKAFNPGEKFWYLGEQYPLRLVEHQRPLLELDGTFNLAGCAQHKAREVFIAWYREETRQITDDLIRSYGQLNGFHINQVRITSARTRWGSCSGKNNLNFTYRLSMAPLPVITYVVVHELVHLKIRNHSRNFWQAVGEIKPDYEQDRRWLKKHGALLTLD